MAPWSAFWDRNFFVERLPALAAFFGSPVVRGAISGVGLVTTLAGLAEFGAAFAGRAEHQPPEGSTLRSDL